MQPSTPVTQNTELVRLIKERPYTNIKTSPSVFGNEPVATPAELRVEVDRLAAAFPQMNREFFGYVLKEAYNRGISRKRMEYIVNHIFDTYQYATITMAAIFDIDEYVHELTPQEIRTLRIPHEPLASICFCGKHRIVYKKDADAFGYPSKPYLSNAELEEKERLEDEERHRKEMEQYDKNHQTSNIKH